MWYPELRASLEIQGWALAASHLSVPRTQSWATASPLPPVLPQPPQQQRKALAPVPSPVPVSCPTAGAADIPQGSAVYVDAYLCNRTLILQSGLHGERQEDKQEAVQSISKDWV